MVSVTNNKVSVSVSVIASFSAFVSVNDYAAVTVLLNLSWIHLLVHVHIN